MQINYPSFLKSSSIVKPLIPALWARLAIGGVSTFFSLIAIVIPVLYESLERLDGLVSILSAIVAISTLVMALIWIYKLHQDFSQLYQGYPISPKQSLAQFMIPFYNIWGIWNTLTTIAKHFIGENITENFGRSIQSLVPGLYGVSVLSNILNRTVLRQETNNPGSTSPVMFLVTAIVDLVLSFILLQLGLNIANGIAAKAS